MSNGWTPQRRARQAALIRSWKPWERSSGPRTAKGKARSARNAWKGGTSVMLRTMRRLVNAEVRGAQRLLDAISGRSKKSEGAAEPTRATDAGP